MKRDLANLKQKRPGSDWMAKKKEDTPNISGSFQMVDDDRKEDLKKLRKDNKLDEETEYYARIFMED